MCKTYNQEIKVSIRYKKLTIFSFSYVRIKSRFGFNFKKKVASFLQLIQA